MLDLNQWQFDSSNLWATLKKHHLCPWGGCKATISQTTNKNNTTDLLSAFQTLSGGLFLHSAPLLKESIHFGQFLHQMIWIKILRLRLMNDDLWFISIKIRFISVPVCVHVCCVPVFGGQRRQLSPWHHFLIGTVVREPSTHWTASPDTLLDPVGTEDNVSAATHKQRHTNVQNSWMISSTIICSYLWKVCNTQ